APLHTYNPIYNYNIEVKKYNPKAVFSIYFSVVRMEKVAKSGSNTGKTSLICKEPCNKIAKILEKVVKKFLAK
ncbi:hypothetical protein, partial [Sellimonas catena]|uniref:hypothetical protein n=1 Tax=Sellimonas catena TaxID=2994035 RepID=UPI002492A8A4